MNHRARNVILMTMFLASCGSKSDSQPAKPNLPTLVRPVAAPVQLGKRVMKDLRQQTRAARERAEQFDAAANQDR